MSIQLMIHILWIILISSCLLLTLTLGIAWYFTSTIMYPHTNRDLQSRYSSVYDKNTNPRDLGLAYEDISFQTSDNITISAWYIHFQVSAPSIILVHGHGDTRLRLLAYAPFLYKAGMNLLLLDLRNCGRSRTSGSFTSMGYYEKEDIRAAVDFLEQKRSGLIGIFAHSMGGAAALIAMAEDKRIRAAITEGTYAKFANIIYARQKHRYRWMPRFLINVIFWLFKKRSGIDIHDISPLHAIKQITPRPILLIHGTEDDIVTHENADELYQAAQSSTELWKVEGGDHTSVWHMLQAETEKTLP